MNLLTFRRSFTALLIALAFMVTGYAQTGNDATPAQRLEIMRQKLDTLRTSLKSTVSVMKKDKRDGDDE
ncbi:MAG: hypothetical protein KDB79_10115, partial [Acidobacteria bacterium]|nr:hypothetical protein [Acidobacteriota bacterium]